AGTAGEAVDRTRREAAALAARIQQAEAGITAGEARLALVAEERRGLDARLAEKEQPLVRLSAALQTMSRRPLSLSALQPGPLKETVYLRAVFASTLPQIRARTENLRSELAHRRALEEDARLALELLRNSESQLAVRRRELTALEGRQDIALRQARVVAARERERALVFAEDARDLDALVGELDRAAALRQELALLEGPIVRPGQPGASRENRASNPPQLAQAGDIPGQFQLPVNGRTISGFGETGIGGVRASGLTLAPRPGAQIVAPARGRVAFSGPYRGFGRIVIIEHGGGWTSLVTGLQQGDVEVGDQLLAGSPLGRAGSDDTAITYELRRNGLPVNPLEYIAS
ncbi:MAG TPA: metalloendopeptidase, partial [Erythrobacter sp.]|nr:metalloendopeptidase [Erythrobacter sp.]